jgi:hypothetical protein
MRRWWWSLAVLCGGAVVGLLAAYGGRMPAVVTAFAG